MGVALWRDGGVRGGALVAGVTVVASEETRLWLKVAFTKLDGMKATFSHLCGVTPAPSCTSTPAPPLLRNRTDALAGPPAGGDVVVDHAGGLHHGVARGGADEPEAAAFELLGHG